MSSVHFGRKPNRKRVCGSLNRTSQNHYGSKQNRTGTGQNHAFRRLITAQVLSRNWPNLSATFFASRLARQTSDQNIFVQSHPWRRWALSLAFAAI